MQRLLFLGLLLHCLGGTGAAYASVFANARADSTVDALLRQVAVQPADTGRVRQLADLCYAFHDAEPTRALQYGEQAVRLATRLHDRPGLLRSLLNLSSCYANLADAAHALRLQQQALALARQLRDSDGIVRSFTGMGSVHHERNDTASALLQYRRALAQAYEPGVRVSTQLMLFGNLGNLYSYLGDHTQALLHTRRALQLARATHDEAGESLYLANLGSYYIQLDKLKIAEGLLRQAVAMVEPIHNPRLEASHLELLATVLLLQNQLDEAETFTRRALRLARRSAYQERALDAYSLMAEIKASRRQFEEAFVWQSRHRDLNDSLNSRSRVQTLAALQTRFETAEKEHQIKLLTQRGELQQVRNRELWAVVGALALGLGGMGVLYWQLRQSRTALAANHAALHQVTHELREVAASKDRLYAIIAHDLRGPVTSFVGVTELIDFYLQHGDEKNLRRLPALVRQSAQSLNSLLDNLLNWAVSQSGELVSQPEELVVKDLYTEIQDLYRTTAEAKQVHLVASAPSYLRVTADRNLLRTILRNLVGNALKCTPVGGRVQLTATAEAGMVALTVTDTGQGMTPEQVAALLAPTSNSGISTVPSAMRKGRFGTGLGWPLCRAFAARLGATLTMTSRVGNGTTVRVQLPAPVQVPVPQRAAVPA